MMLRFFFSAVFLLSAFLIHGQSDREDYAIHFRTGTIVPAINADSFLVSFDISGEALFRDRFFRIIQFNDIPADAVKEALQQGGITLFDYLPRMAYFASFTRDFDREAAARSGIRSIIGISPDYKLSPTLYEGNIPVHAFTGNGNVSVLAGYWPDLDPDLVIASLQEKGFIIPDRNDFGHYLKVEIPVSQIGALATLPQIVYLEPVNPEPVPDNYTGRTLHRTNAIATDFNSGRHFDGSGVNVELQDDGIIGPHIDYQGRIPEQFLTNNNGNHGDHCAGIIMGAGNADPLGKGQAPGASLYVYGASPYYPGFNAIPQDYGNLGIRITSTSYSDGCNAGYTSLARTLDQQIRTYPSLMHVFSAGNNGSADCGYGAGAGWGNVTGGHKIGKNVIAVANVDYTDNLSSSSSRGPAHDGRIKPDLAAKGSNVYSTVDPNDYALKSGTSMSCPAVSGTLAQLYQAYREYFNGKDPMAGLIKGILLNTADDLGNPGPDFKFGWGRINALRAVRVIEESRFDSGTLSQGQTHNHTINVPAGTAQLRVMICWTDREAAINTNWALVNDLDMILTDPSAGTWLPWKLSHYPHPDSLNMPAFRGTDDRNNMEQVTLDDPAAGTYSAMVEGSAVPQGPQTYYILWEFIPEEVTLTYPAGGETMVPGESETLRWDAFGTGGTFMLEFSSDNGASWEVIAEDVAADLRYFSWAVPPVITGQGLIKITQGSSVSQTEAVFSIIGVPCSLQIDWACGDAVHLSWNSVTGADSYEILRLGEKYMETLGTTTVTSYIAEDTNVISNSWFTVRAVGADGATGRRAVAVEREPGSFNCFPTDAMLSDIPTASWGVYQSGWMDLSAVTVTVVVRNYGTEPVVNPPLKYRLGSAATVTEAYQGIIEPDSTLIYSFQQTIDLSVPGSYTLKAWIDYSGDQNPANDLLELPVEVTEGVTVSFGYGQNFDGWEKCVSAPACELITCDLSQGWINLTNEVWDQHDWRTYSGSTTTQGTGPDADHTTGTSAGQYLYMEPSTYCLNKTALIITPCIDLVNGVSPTLSLWYHAWGADIGRLHVDLFDGSAIIHDIVPPIAGNQGNEWKELVADLSPWNGQVVSIRLRGITSCTQYGDLAIDDFSVADITGIVHDAGSPVNRLRIHPNPACGEATVLLQGAGEADYTLLVTDLFGRRLISGTVIPSGGKIRETLDLGSLPAGVYLVSLSSVGESHIAKLSVY